MFSSRHFMISDFTFKSLIHFKLTFVSDVRVHFYSPACGYSTSPKLFLKGLSFPKEYSSIPHQILVMN